MIGFVNAFVIQFFRDINAKIQDAHKNFFT